MLLNLLSARFDRKQMGPVGDVQYAIGDNRCAVNGIAHVDFLLGDEFAFWIVRIFSFHGDLWVGRVAKHGDVAVLVADINFPAHD